MIVLKNNIKNLLCKELDVTQRGLILTAMLCKETIPAFTEAKFKLFVDYKKHASDLVYLHESGYIKWEKYKYYKEKIQEDKLSKSEIVHDIIKFMNEIYGRKFDYKSKVTTNLKARLKEYSIEDIKLVIANRYEKWKNDPVMKENLNPVTIFRATLFAKYLEEAQRTGTGKGIISVSNIGLEEGDEITYEVSRKLVEKDIYTFKTFQTDSNGTKKGNGKIQSNKGKQIKILLNVQENLIKNGGVREFIYIFIKK